ncbi:maleylpyruvate isomerase family mycothiol-dependent enzyme [Aeromicrobium halocynthiae]|uniref:Maleylpyruvate isomerase family mycothiol-dependent enzyme n=1 Tax=Aeromicrobium halocynthiae TaxID=560557 RepID=A0ABP5HIR2_9ACTN
MTDLRTYVDAWRHSAHAVLDLTDDIADHEWMLSTDLPGWDVHDVVAHLAHLEAVLAGQTPDTEVDATASGVLSTYTEAGVQERRGMSPADVVAELRAGVAAREAALVDLPTDPGAPADRTPGAAPWTWEVLLRNRAIDAWCHEQDLRRALGRPGSLDTPGAHVTTRTFAAAMPFVLGKKVAPPAGTSVTWEVRGPVELAVGATIGPDGRAAPDRSDSPDVTLRMGSEDFCILGAGRRRPEAVDVTLEGDEALGARVLAAMAVTI